MSVFRLYARRVLRRPYVLLLALVLPLLMVEGIVLQYRSATSFSVHLSIPDATLHQVLVDELDKASVEHVDVPVDERSGVSGVLVAIDSAAGEIAGHPQLLRAHVTYHPTNANNILLTARMNSIVSTIAYLAANSADEQAFTAALRDFAQRPAPVRSETEVVGNTNNTVLVATFNMIVFIVLLLAMSTILMFVRDKRAGTSQRILAATRNKLTYYLQLVLLFAIIGAVELLVMIAAMVWLYQVPLGLGLGRLLLLAAGFVLFTVFAIALGLLLVSHTSTESTGRLLVTTVTLPMAMLGGALWPLSIMPGWMRGMAQALPTTWLTQLNGALFSGFALPTWSVARPLLLLTGVVVVLFAALSRVPSERM